MGRILLKAVTHATWSAPVVVYLAVDWAALSETLSSGQLYCDSIAGGMHLCTSPKEFMTSLFIVPTFLVVITFGMVFLMGFVVALVFWIVVFAIAEGIKSFASKKA